MGDTIKSFLKKNRFKNGFILILIIIKNMCNL